MSLWLRSAARRLASRWWHSRHWRPRLSPTGARRANGQTGPATDSRPALIIKADDFGGPLSAAACDFIEVVAGAGGVAALGLITSRLAPVPEIIGTYQRLYENGFELWLHGHAHAWTLPRAEFCGVGIDQQIASLETGLRCAREILGIHLHTFGAPGNAHDEDTAIALGRFPELRVWLFGDETRAAEADTLVLRRQMELEPAPGVVAEPAAFLAELDASTQRRPRLDVLTLQAHPFTWSRSDLIRFAEILSWVAPRFRFTTPYRFWRTLSGKSPDARTALMPRRGNRRPPANRARSPASG